MNDLATKNCYELTQKELEIVRESFDAAWSNEEEVNDAIRSSALNGYIMDPHTATCMKASRLGGSKNKIIYSTAEWTKFSPTLLTAVGGKKTDDKTALIEISKRYNAKVPKMIDEIFDKEIAQRDLIDKSDIEKAIKEFLG